LGNLELSRVDNSLSDAVTKASQGAYKGTEAGIPAQAGHILKRHHSRLQHSYKPQDIQD
jgi:hypothetical protein